MKKSVKILTAIISAGAACAAVYKIGKDKGFFDALRTSDECRIPYPDDISDEEEDDVAWYEDICGEPDGYAEDVFKEYSPICKCCNIDHCIDCGYYYVMKELNEK